LKTNGELGKRFPVDGFSRGLELGCGCGMVGLTLVNSLNGMDVSLTDLPEATDIANRNAWTWDPPSPRGPYISFDELDWDAELPQNLTFDDEIDDFQLLVAADCTYNPDSRYVYPERE
jgi:methylase of polypeptide subunit release factors